MPTVEDVLFDKLRETLLLLLRVGGEFKTYSAKDIAALIKAKMKSKREPTALSHIYELEEMITGLRASLEKAKENYVNLDD
jgi:hypothetical protein